MAMVGLNRFEDVDMAALASMPPEERDLLGFGVVGLDKSGLVAVYNAVESKMAGLEAASIVGTPFFEAVAQCMNNFMVAQRFEDEPELDVIIPYVLTFRMRPTRVRLRLLASPSASLNFILIER